MRHKGMHAQMYSWGKGVYKFRKLITTVWFLLFVTFLPLAFQLPSILQQNGFTPEDSPSLIGIQKLEEGLGLSSNTLELVIASRDGSNLTTGIEQKRILQELSPLLDEPYVEDMYFQIASRQPGGDHIQAVTVLLNEDTADTLKHFDDIREAVPEITGADVYIAGNTAVFADMNDAVKSDILRAEVIGLPLALLILLLVFGTLTSALLPLICGIISVAVTMGLLYVWALIDGNISNFLPNAVTMLGLAVGIDYALFIVSRFREELPARGTEEAVAAASASAGKAVVFSGAAVLIGFVAMAFIDLPIFRSFSIGGIAVVLVSVLAANTLLPALLGLLGPRINSIPIRLMPRRYKRGQSQGAWRRISAFVMKRPITISLGVILLLAAAMFPISSIKVSIPAAEVLPPSYESRQGYDLMAQAYHVRELNPLLAAVELPDSYDSPESIKAVKEYMDQVRQLPGVQRVESYTSAARGSAEEAAQQIARPEISSQLEKYRVVSGNMAVVAIVPKSGDFHAQTQELIEQLRNLKPEGLEVYITGTPAYKLDIIQKITEGAPAVLLFVFVTTYLVLMFAFRSLILPLKASIMNILSLGAGLGIVVWVFQEGVGAEWLGVTYTGSVFALLPVLIFCVVFGISMDYEVILLSRIMESYERTGDNEQSTAEGLEHTGGMITSAALILAVVVGAFIFTDNEVMKGIGLGLTAAVLLDATVIRVLLVPAFMKLLGKANWWSPRWLFAQQACRPAAGKEADPGHTFALKENER